MMMMTSSLALAVGLLASLVAAEYPTHAKSGDYPAHGGPAYPSAGGSYPAHGAAAGAYPSAGGAYPAHGAAGGAYPSAGGAYPAYGAAGAAYPAHGGAHGSGDGAYSAYAGAGGAYQSGSGAYPAYSGGAGAYQPAYGAYAPQPYAAPAPAAPAPKPLTELDKLFARVGDINAEIYIMGNDIDKLKTRAMLSVRSWERLEAEVMVTGGAINSITEELRDIVITLISADNQNDEINNDPLPSRIVTLQSTLMMEAGRLVMADLNDANDARDIAGVGTKLTAAKRSVNWRMDLESDNYFQRLDLLREQLDKEIFAANREICESGTVAIHRDDPRVEVLFMNNFGSDIPHTTYGISGYEFDLKAKQHESKLGGGAYPGNHGGHGGAYGGGYNGGYGGAPNYGFSYEPNSLGVFVSQMTTNKGITFEAVNLGFGQSDLIAVRVSYQTCNVGNSPDVYQQIG